MSVQRRVLPESFKREAAYRVANSGLTAGAVATELRLAIPEALEHFCSLTQSLTAWC